jgi:hypothetical protein
VIAVDLSKLLDALVEATPVAIDEDWRRETRAEPGTVAWSYALAGKLGVPPERVIRSHKPVPRCLTASRAGIDALRYFGVEALPVPVEALVGNPAFVASEAEMRAGTLSEEDAVARGVRYLQIDLTSQRDNGWPGHMVVGVPAADALLDLDLGQFNRPEKSIVLPRAASFAVDSDFWADPDAATGYLVAGCRVVYHRIAPVRPWTGAPDWRKHGPRVAGPVIRKLKEVRP